MEIQSVAVDELTSDPRNTRKHSSRNIEAIAASLKQFGQQSPIVVSTDMIVRKGNGTLAGAKQLGWTHIDCVITDLEGKALRAYAIADNRSGDADVGSTWDGQVLAEELDELKDDYDIDSLGFNDDEFAALAKEHGIVEVAGHVRSTPEPTAVPEHPQTELGDLWVMGPHRLLCGDCRKTRDMQILFGDDRINMAITSPPYASQRKYDEGSEFKPIPPEEYSDWFAAVADRIDAHLAEDGSYFLNIKEHCIDGQRDLYVKELVVDHVRKWGWLWVEEYVWTHGGTPRAVVNRFKNGWEPIFHFTRRRNHKFTPDNVRHWSENVVDWGGAHPSDEDKQGDPQNKFRASKGSNASKQGQVDALDGIEEDGATVAPGWAYPNNVLSLGKNREALGHPAAYPVTLPEFFIKAYSEEGDIVFDPFMGSGSTLMATHRLDRRSFGTEISPAYCDVICQRYYDLTGEIPKRLAGQAFEIKDDSASVGPVK